MLPNIGWGELMLVFLIVLLLFGARRLPEIGRSIGKAIQSFKKGISEESDTPEEDPEEDKDKKNN